MVATYGASRVVAGVRPCRIPSQTRTDEIADGIYRVSTFVPEMTPEGFTFNQFLIDADEPLLGIEGRAPNGITIEANRPLDDYVSYTSLGHARMLNGALQMGTFTVCRSGQRELHVVLASSGRVRVEKTASSCP